MKKFIVSYDQKY